MWSRREWASRSGPCCGRRRPIPTEIATWTESTGPSAHAVLAHDTRSLFTAQLLPGRSTNLNLGGSSRLKLSRE
ncbi:unnamed protein product [Arctia plantaginis]|uniref:Uncharacterized protein n=1 Tax=Arctia plantaginis TaxID=874455 RepID=A0A8S0ZKE5_ARCPL|nr:unnamed protein product [Arctia plantaginis]CAB3238262.1 unnamed protein product [Arctia plantaginis]